MIKFTNHPWIAAATMAMVFSSCNTAKEKGKTQTILLPAQAEVYNPYGERSANASRLKSPHARIYTAVNVSCATCLLSLENWDHFQTEIAQYHVPVIPICRSKDGFETLKFLFENNKIEKIHLSLILDLKNAFIQQNKGLAGDRDELTVLVDANDQVLLSGDPIYDESTKDKFIKKIQEIK